MMPTERNAFVALCQLASRKNWCWKLACTTCGHLHFRYGLYELSLGRHPDSHQWQTKEMLDGLDELLGDMETITRRIQRSRRLYDVLSDASIKEIAAGCRFPNFLGYLGLGLYYAEQQEQLSRRLTEVWGTQLLEMVGNRSRTAALLAQCLSDPASYLRWSDLEGVEQALRPEYRDQSGT